MSTYKFNAPENTACFVCDHVFARKRPILYVTHDEDGYWQFLCGHTDHTEASIKIISLGQAARIDGSINDLHEMPYSQGAERELPGNEWKRFHLPEE